AQFVMVEAFRQFLYGKSLVDDSLLDVYRRVAFEGQGMPPSGADLIAQLHGGLCYFHRAKKETRVFRWPFHDMDFCLVHTGNKLATHHHLKKLGDKDFSNLEAIVMTGKKSLEERDSGGFARAVQAYAGKLLE